MIEILLIFIALVAVLAISHYTGDLVAREIDEEDDDVYL